MTAIDKLRAIVAASEGVTKGPWEAEITTEALWVGTRSDEGSPAVVIYSEEYFELPDIYKECVAANAAHIARCDPDTLREILAEVEALKDRIARLQESEVGLVNAAAMQKREHKIKIEQAVNEASTTQALENGASATALRAENERLKSSMGNAIRHIEHMAAWITKQNAGYSFEALGEDIEEFRSPQGDRQ